MLFYTVQRVRDLGTTQPYLGCLYQPPLLKAKGSMLKRSQKDCKSQKWWIAPGRQCFSDTTGLMYRGLHRLKPWSPSTERGKLIWDPTPNQEAFSSWYQIVREKNQLSSMESHWVYSSHFMPGPMPMSSLDSTKWTQ